MMKTTLIPLLALALASGTAFAAAHDDPDARRDERRWERREGRPGPERGERRGRRGEGPGNRREGLPGPISEEMRQEIREIHRVIKGLADAARAESDPTRKAEVVDLLRAKLYEAADKMQAHQERRLAEAEERLARLKERVAYARENRAEMIEEQIQRILAGEPPRRPAAFDDHPYAKGGRRGPGGEKAPPPAE